MPEEKKNKEELEAGSKEEEEPQKQSPEPEEGKEPKRGEGEEHIDYKAELERLKGKDEQLKKAEYKIQELKREKKEQGESLTADDVKGIVDEAVEKATSGVKREIYRSRFDEELDKVSSSDDEKDLIKYHYENTISPTGNLKEDLDNAKVLANKKRILAQQSEMMRSQRSKQSAGQGAGAGQKPSPSKSVDLSGQSEGTKKHFQSLQDRGWKLDSKKGLLVSPSGKRGWSPEQGQVRLEPNEE